jgi:hypothetical protein
MSKQLVRFDTELQNRGVTIDEIHGLTKMVDFIKLAKEFPGTDGTKR